MYRAALGSWRICLWTRRDIFHVRAVAHKSVLRIIDLWEYSRREELFVGGRNPRKISIDLHRTLCFNPLYAKFFFYRNIEMYLQFILFLLTDMTGSWNPSSCKIRTYLFCIVNVMDADVLATQGTRTSATMVLNMLNQNNSVPAY